MALLQSAHAVGSSMGDGEAFHDCLQDFRVSASGIFFVLKGSFFGLGSRAGTAEKCCGS